MSRRGKNEHRTKTAKIAFLNLVFEIGAMLKFHAHAIGKTESDVINYALRQYFMGMTIKSTVKQLKRELDRIMVKLDGTLVYDEKEVDIKTGSDKEEVTVPDMGEIEPSEGDHAYVKGEMFIYLGGEWKNTKDVYPQDNDDDLRASVKSLFAALKESYEKEGEQGNKRRP